MNLCKPVLQTESFCLRFGQYIACFIIQNITTKQTKTKKYLVPLYIKWL